MSKEKTITNYLIIIFTFSIIINLILCLKIYKNSITLKNEQNGVDNKNILEEKYYENMTLKDIENNITYYKVKNCVDTYYMCLRSLWTDISSKRVYGENEEIIDGKYQFSSYQAKKIMSILAKEYIDKYNLNTNNIGQKFSYLEQGNEVYKKILEYNMPNSLSFYIVYGTTINNTKKNDFKLILLMDNNNNSFAIYPEEFIIDKGIDKLDIGDKIPSDFENIKKIQSNTYNNIDNSIASLEKTAEDYYYLYTLYLKSDIETAFNLLNTEYKEKKFSNIEDFKTFVTRKYNNNWYNLKGYSTTTNNQYSQYTCLDNYNNYFIFRETAPMNYSVMLDTYTLDLPEFIEKYENSTSQEKTALNIQKIVDALNDGDYKYVYGKLAQEFKQNKFQTLENFEQYAKNTFGKNNMVTYNSFIETGNYCTYEITLKNEQHEIKKTIIMKLQEGTNFVFSFNVD